MDSLAEDVPVAPTEEIESVTNDKVAERRQLLQKQLRGKRDSKLTKKLSTDNQLLAVAREDLQLKRKVLDQMEEADKKHHKTMDSLLQGFTSLTSPSTMVLALLVVSCPSLHNSQHHKKYIKRQACMISLSFRIVPL